jgi:hypothetical protein
VGHEGIAAWYVYHNISLAAITAIALGIGNGFTRPVARVLLLLVVKNFKTIRLKNIFVMEVCFICEFFVFFA